MHSNVGGSTVGRILDCPASLRLVEEMPARPDSDNAFTRRGTALHTLAEMFLSEGGFGNHLVGTEMHGHVVTQDDFDLGLLPAVRSINEHPDKLIVLALERLVTMPGVENAYGTADLVAWNSAEQRPVVADFKFGQGVIVDPDTAQLRFYAAAAMADPELAEYFKSSEVELAIVQPNDRNLPTYRSIVVDRVELFDFTVAVRNAVKASKHATPTPGSACRWCPAKLTCPALVETARQLPTIDRTQLAELLDLIDPLNSWINGVLETAHELLEAGERVPRWKLVQKAARRQWIDADAAIKRLKAANAYSDHLVEPASLRSPAQVEKLLAKEQRELLADLIEARSSGTVVVHESDKRQAVSGPGDAMKKLSIKYGATK